MDEGSGSQRQEEDTFKACKAYTCSAFHMDSMDNNLLSSMGMVITDNRVDSRKE